LGSGEDGYQFVNGSDTREKANDELKNNVSWLRNILSVRECEYLALVMSSGPILKCYLDFACLRCS
jgi:hypothetical protein